MSSNFRWWSLTFFLFAIIDERGPTENYKTFKLMSFFPLNPFNKLYVPVMTSGDWKINPPVKFDGNTSGRIMYVERFAYIGSHKSTNERRPLVIFTYKMTFTS